MQKALKRHFNCVPERQEDGLIGRGGCYGRPTSKHAILNILTTKGRHEHKSKPMTHTRPAPEMGVDRPMACTAIDSLHQLQTEQEGRIQPPQVWPESFRSPVTSLACATSMQPCREVTGTCYSPLQSKTPPGHRKTSLYKVTRELAFINSQRGSLRSLTTTWLIAM